MSKSAVTLPLHRRHQDIVCGGSSCVCGRCHCQFATLPVYQFSGENATISSVWRAFVVRGTSIGRAMTCRHMRHRKSLKRSPRWKENTRTPSTASTKLFTRLFLLASVKNFCTSCSLRWLGLRGSPCMTEPHGCEPSWTEPNSTQRNWRWRRMPDISIINH